MRTGLLQAASSAVFSVLCGWSCAQSAPDARTDVRPQVAQATSQAVPDLFKKIPSDWTQAEREWGFRQWDLLGPTRPVRTGAAAKPLPPGPPMAGFAEGTRGARQLAGYTSEHKLAGLVVLQGGRVRLERYALGHDEKSKWTSFSVAKSLLSVLVGAALKDGHIRSLDDPIVQYIKGLAGSAYDGVTVRQLLTMTTGARWNNDYSDSDADSYKLFRAQPADGLDVTTSYMRQVKRKFQPGTKWHYNSGETTLLGVLVREAARKPLADYASEKIWATFGMEQDASWNIDATGVETGGCCFQATTRDFARFGQFVLEGARINGESIVPPGYLEDATRKQNEVDWPGHGYGYQWWTQDDGSFDAMGIHGQLIHIDPARKLVIVMNSAWSRALERGSSDARTALVYTIKRLLDAE